MTGEWNTFGGDVESRLPQRVCAVCVLLASVTKKEADHIASVVDNPEHSTRAIYDALKSRGVHIGRDKLTDHRNGRCA